MLIFLLDKLVGVLAALPLVLLFLFFADKKRFTKKWFWAVLFVAYMNAMLIMVTISILVVVFINNPLMTIFLKALGEIS